MSDQGPAQGGVVLTGGHGSGQPLDTVRTEVGDVEETVGTGSWTDRVLDITDNDQWFTWCSPDIGIFAAVAFLIF